MAASSPYDPIAGMYHLLWADWYLPAALPALEKLFFSRVPSGETVLDVCCGSGHVTRELVKRGYRVTAMDASAELIGIARSEMPDVDWQVGDVTKLETPAVGYSAALSTIDSFNHLLTSDDLQVAFAGIRRALARGGLLVFDMNLAEAYFTDLKQWAVDIGTDHAGLVRGVFEPANRKATTELIWFERHGDCWKRRDSRVEQRAYPEEEVMAALENAGFRELEAIPAHTAGIEAELGFGRVFYSARA